MKERPILFSSPMVLAILEGRKTQTRRIMNLIEFQPCTASGDGWDWDFRDRRGRWNSYTTKQLVESKRNPYGTPGDRLWVRETWGRCDRDRVIYRADDIDALAKERNWVSWPTWRPSIFMPRWASRITLEVTEVRVQRLHEISEEDAKAEGVTPYTPPDGHISLDQRVPGPGFDRCRLGDQPHRLPFADLWDTINGKRAPWSSNPWVWAISFRRVP